MEIQNVILGSHNPIEYKNEDKNKSETVVESEIESRRLNEVKEELRFNSPVFDWIKKGSILFVRILIWVGFITRIIMIYLSRRQ